MGFAGGLRPDLFTSSRGQYFNVRVLYAVLVLLVSLYHGGGFSAVETPAKCVVLAYIVLNIGKYRWNVLICGVAAGAVIAAGSAIVDLYVYHADRPFGLINPIRLGMIALTFGAISAVGLMHTRSSSWQRSPSRDRSPVSQLPSFQARAVRCSPSHSSCTFGPGPLAAVATRLRLWCPYSSPSSLL